MQTQLQDIALGLRARARSKGHRLALVLSGGPDWTLAAARGAVSALALGDDSTALWLTDRVLVDPPSGITTAPIASGTRLVGGESGLLVYDAWSGFDPDGFGAATGTLRGGGLLVLLTPPLADWATTLDPQAERIAVWPHDAATVSGRFLRRLSRILASHPAALVVTQGRPLPDAPPIASTPAASWPGVLAPNPAEPATVDQALAVEALLQLARGRARRPLVLTAHRGRGKSAALGIAAARLAQAGARRILVTAPRRAACEALFRHAALAWPGAVQREGGLGAAGSSIEFRAPDGLCEGGAAKVGVRGRAMLDPLPGPPPARGRERNDVASCDSSSPEADLLLVDEAAGIPAPLLETLLDRYPRVAFATTVHGYEGTGRGFEVRFRHTLDRRAPGWRALTLGQPIRWSAHDPLESLVFRALLLDASAAEPTGIRYQEAGFTRLDRDTLSTDETGLAQVFGLLVLAHYQTRPLDLRMLLDGPNVRVYCLREIGEQRGRVVATLLAAEEGGMDDPDLRRAIFEGRRRPRGHLLPQTLSAHAGLAHAPALRYLRVIRIAVHPALARRGLGRRLLRGLQHEARRDGFDLVGASFGATPDLIGFWAGCGYRPAQVGTSRNTASGEHALVMLRPLNGAGIRLAAGAERRLEQRLPVLLPGPLRRWDPGTAAALACALHASPPTPASGVGLESPDPDVDAFIQGHRTLEAALPALADLTRRRLGPALRAGTIALPDAALVVAATRQLRPVAELVTPFAARGRADLIRRLRQLIGQI